MDRIVVGRAEFRAKLTTDARFYVHLTDFTDRAGLGIRHEGNAVLYRADMDAEFAAPSETLSLVDECQHLGLFLAGPSDQNILHQLPSRIASIITNRSRRYHVKRTDAQVNPEPNAVRRKSGYTLEFMSESKLFQKGLGLKAQVQAPLQKDYQGWIVDLARAHDYRLRAGDLTIRLAKEFGFCYGVDRAVEYAYEARARFPERDIYITGEIIHNPYVNRRLREMGIRFLIGPYGTEDKFEPITASDVVLLPAFGVSMEEMNILKSRGCIMVDTTCGSVLNVWKNVERYAKSGVTSIVHGRYSHEETMATVSRASRFPGGHYVVVRDMDEARAVCKFIEHGGDADAFLATFASACSPDFDPDRHLERIGLANQTTMLSSESLAIEDELRKAMTRRYGEGELAERFRSFDTICSATQERQDAVIQMTEDRVNLMLVLGGYNSSNTTHLAEISSQHCPTYHIADSSCLVSPIEIRHKPLHEEQETTTLDWLPDGPLMVGITAGASTPDVKVDESIERLISFRGLSASDLKPG